MGAFVAQDLKTFSVVEKCDLVTSWKILNSTHIILNLCWLLLRAEWGSAITTWPTITYIHILNYTIATWLVNENEAIYHLKELCLNNGFPEGNTATHFKMFVLPFLHFK